MKIRQALIFFGSGGFDWPPGGRPFFQKQISIQSDWPRFSRVANHDEGGVTLTERMWNVEHTSHLHITCLHYTCRWMLKKPYDYFHYLKQCAGLRGVSYLTGCFYTVIPVTRPPVGYALLVHTLDFGTSSVISAWSRTSPRNRVRSSPWTP